MKNINKYPKVLIIYNSCINKIDHHGVSIREWFADWPKDNLAQIYSGMEVGEERFCGNNFKLGENERKFGKYFFKLKNSSIGQSSYSIVPNQDFQKLDKLKLVTVFKNKISNFAINSGLWEVIFRPKLSTELSSFIEKFKPQIVYCQGYSLTFTWLPVMVNKKYNIPICFQTGDDWPAYLYKNSPFAFALRPLVKRSIKVLLNNSAARLANGKLMAKEYKERYKLFFEYIMMCDDQSRFKEAIPNRIVSDDIVSILYSGSLGLERWKLIIDLCEIAKQIEVQSGKKIIVIVLATFIPLHSINKLREIDNLKLLAGATHEELPSFLKGADILYLPETFDQNLAKEIHLSISTKAHFYMMSEKPVLVFASPVAGIIDYAKQDEWACTVEEYNLHKLSESLKKLITDIKYREVLINKGLEVVASNHTGYKVREKFLNILNQINQK